MSAEWELLRGLFEGALERPTHERAAFLDEHTKNDPILRRDIESLLAAHESAGPFLSAAAFGPAVDRSDDPAEQQPSASGQTRLAAGTSLGVFTIVELLGAGGMGEVYRARDTRLDRQVAIKVLTSERDTAPGARERFEREARAISRLSHPRICTDARHRRCRARWLRRRPLSRHGTARWRDARGANRSRPRSRSNRRSRTPSISPMR